MLCLTVYEAKGLEFDDVFLFNFFSGDNIEAGHWKLLNEIGIEEAISENAGQEEIFTKIDQFCANAAEEENKVAYSHIRKESDKANVIKMQRMINESTKNRSLIYRKYSLLCVELKYLYVAITRPRKRLIIYDEKVKIRQPI
jgi:superfamily I DNA/RNA helicase